ncbi:MAG: 3'(2'),5'-bisphosphate nucleotidase CysQ, partial [Cyclobacteriaceae bacterium]|nr:3'(2'),5'-bisphosphate nucleotidase CysQ [Cyclobacteriaceae bacterium]
MDIAQEKIIEIAYEAGREILRIYNDPEFFAEVEVKADQSPLTLADKRSNDIIGAGLSEIHPEIPIISEEGKEVLFRDRKNYDRFWLVDPLDGTKEFINRNGEFTVNIALIENNYPVAGFIYAPVLDCLYYAVDGKAFKREDGLNSRLSVRNKNNQRVAVRSRSHAVPAEEEILRAYDVIESVSRGSSLKFCIVAEGKADLYYRHGPTMEWDTAAGQAVLESSGGRMYVGDDTAERFVYNKENLLNPGFLCLG